MKRFITILLIGILAPITLLGQAKIVTKKAKIVDMRDKTTKIVLTGNEFIDSTLKEEVKSRWILSPFEFCTYNEFRSLMNNPEYYFLINVQSQFNKESRPGIDLFTFVKGDPNADGKISDMLEIVTVPFASCDNPSGRGLVFMPAIIDIIQNYALKAMRDDVLIYTGLSNFATNLSKAKGKSVCLSNSELSEEITDKVKDSYFNENVFAVDEDEANKMLVENRENTLFGYVVCPYEPEHGSFCYKILIDGETHELYYFRKHKITKRRGAGFLKSDIKRIYHAIK